MADSSKKPRNPIFTAPTRDLRKLSPSENVRAGHSRKAENYILRGKRVTKTTKTISKRQFLTLQTAERSSAKPISLEKAARARREGFLGYGTAASERQAQKQRETRRRQTLIKAALKEPPRYSPAAIRPASARRHGPVHYDISMTRNGVRATLEEKIVHEGYIEDGTWHGVMDWLRAKNQEELAGLFRSSGRSTPLV